jgi:hypothetical protein
MTAGVTGGYGRNARADPSSRHCEGGAEPHQNGYIDWDVEGCEGYVDSLTA